MIPAATVEFRTPVRSRRRSSFGTVSTSGEPGAKPATIALTTSSSRSAVPANSAVTSRHPTIAVPAARAGRPAGPCGSFGLVDGPGGVDEPDVAERLREVAEQLTAPGVDLLRQQAHVVGVRGGSLECLPGPADLP